MRFSSANVVVPRRIVILGLNPVCTLSSSACGSSEHVAPVIQGVQPCVCGRPAAQGCVDYAICPQHVDCAGFMCLQVAAACPFAPADGSQPVAPACGQSDARRSKQALQAISRRWRVLRIVHMQLRSALHACWICIHTQPQGHLSHTSCLTGNPTTHHTAADHLAEVVVPVLVPAVVKTQHHALHTMLQSVDPLAKMDVVKQ